MHHISMRFQGLEDAHDEQGNSIPLFPEYEKQCSAQDGKLMAMAVIQAGTLHGDPGVVLIMEHNDLKIAVPITASMYLTLGAGIKAAMEKWGKPWTGA